MESDVLIVFLRALIPGNVKTRLAASVGAQAALSLYSAMLEDLATHIRTVAIESPVEVRPFVDTAGHTGPFVRAEIQRGENIFQRMADAFERTLRWGPQRIVLVGSDIPYLSSGALRELFEGLTSRDACLGPSIDGGYYGIGFRSSAYRREILIPKQEGPRERAADVLTQTESLLDRLGRSYTRARTLRDVDTATDLASVCDCQDFSSVCPALYAATNFLRRGSDLVDPSKEL